MIDVSIIIVNWNTEKMLIDCINSLISETKKHTIEIIVVDNASSDGSVASITKRFPDVNIIVNDKNLGFAKANNIGIKQSRGDYVCLVNTDTIALDGVIDKMKGYMDQNRDIGSMIPENLDAEMNTQLCVREFPTIRNILCEAFYLDKLFPDVHLFRGRAVKKSLLKSIFDADSVPCNYMMIRREALDQIGLLDENFFIYAEDIDWCKRFKDNGWRVVSYPLAKIIHFGGGSSKLAPAKFMIEMSISELQFWRKHYGVIKNKLYRIILTIHNLNRLIGYCFLYFIKPSKRTIIKNNIISLYHLTKFLIFNRGERYRN